MDLIEKFINAMLSKKEVLTQNIKTLNKLFCSMDLSQNNGFVQLFGKNVMVRKLILLDKSLQGLEAASDIRAKINQILFAVFKEKPELLKEEIVLYAYRQIEEIKRLSSSTDEISLENHYSNLEVIRYVKLDAIEYYPGLLSLLLKTLNLEVTQQLGVVSRSLDLLRVVTRSLFLNFGPTFSLKSDDILIEETLNLVGFTDPDRKQSDNNWGRFLNEFWKSLKTIYSNKSRLLYKNSLQIKAFSFYSELSFYFLKYTPKLKRMTDLSLSLSFHYFGNAELGLLENDLLKYLQRRVASLRSRHLSEFIYKLLDQQLSELRRDSSMSLKTLKAALFLVKISSKSDNIVNHGDLMRNLSNCLRFDFFKENPALVQPTEKIVLTKLMTSHASSFGCQKKIFYWRMIEVFTSYIPKLNCERVKMNMFVSLFLQSVAVEDGCFIEDVITFFKNLNEFVSQAKYSDVILLESFENPFKIFTERVELVNFVLYLAFLLVLYFNLNKTKERRMKKHDLEFLCAFLLKFKFKRFCSLILFDHVPASKNRVSTFWRKATLPLLTQLCVKNSFVKRLYFSKLITVIIKNMGSSLDLDIFETYSFLLIGGKLKSGKLNRCKSGNLVYQALFKHKSSLMVEARSIATKDTIGSLRFLRNYISIITMKKKEAGTEEMREVLDAFSQISGQIHISSAEVYSLVSSLLQTVILLCVNNLDSYTQINAEVRKENSPAKLPTNCFRRVFICLFGFISSESFKLAMSALFNLRSAIPVLHGFKMIREESDRILAENDDPNVSIPNVFGSLIFELKSKIQVLLVIPVLILASENESTHLRKYFESPAGSHSESKHLKSSVSYFSKHFSSIWTREGAIGPISLEKLKDSYWKCQNMLNLNLVGFCPVFAEVICLFLEIARRDPKTLTSVFSNLFEPDCSHFDQESQSTNIYEDLDSELSLEEILKARGKPASRNILIDELVLLYVMLADCENDLSKLICIRDSIDMLNLCDRHTTVALVEKLLAEKGVEIKAYSLCEEQYWC
jgi:hypothetical protein